MRRKRQASTAFTFRKPDYVRLGAHACMENLMSDIGPVAPAETLRPVEEHRRVDRDGRKPPRPPRQPRSSDEMIETEAHKLDVEA